MDGEQPYSVGKGFEDSQIYSLDHPRYQAFSARVSEHVQTLAAREAVRRAAKHNVIVTNNVDTVALSELGKLYPEFNLLLAPLNSPGHVLWTTARQLANELIAVRMSTYTASYVHEGVSLLSTLSRGARAVHSECDPTNYITYHDRHTSALDVYRLFGDYEAVRKTTNMVLPRTEYDRYLEKKDYDVCYSGVDCTHKAEGLCVDLTTTQYTPAQVAVAMLQHGSTMARGFFIYHPDMLVSTEGELAGTGVQFSRGDSHITFAYPQGLAGVQSYPLDMWAAWLTCHTFFIGAESEHRVWFQVELESGRGPFMFFNIVRLDSAPGDMVVSHALDLPGNEGKTVLVSKRLRSFRSDPAKLASWHPVCSVVSDRLVQRVYEHAMTLTPEQFSKFAVRKQLGVVNDRWVTAGTAISVAKPLSIPLLGDLTDAIHAAAFVDRYDQGRLTTDMMKSLNELVKFGSYSRFQRIAVVGSFALRWLWDHSLGIANNFVRLLCDKLRQFLGNAPLDLEVQLASAPTYFRVETATAGWRDKLASFRAGLLSKPVPMSVNTVVSSGMGGAMSSVLLAGGRAVTSEVGVSIYRVSSDVVDTHVRGHLSKDAKELIAVVKGSHVVDGAPLTRHDMAMESVVRDDQVKMEFRCDYSRDPDPVSSMNLAYDQALPGVADQNLEYDTASLSLDPQDRTLAAPYLRMPMYFGLPPNPRTYYHSKLRALNVPKRQQTGQELLSAVASRNLSAPSIALPQNQDILIKDVWEVFLDKACVDDARDKLRQYAADPVSMEEGALADWTKQAKPEVVLRVKKELEQTGKTLEEMDVGDYIAMIKADAKPTLSTKPLFNRTDPQVIVYHEKPLSMLYSSIFRVLVRRFLSLLKPNYYINILKDVKDMSEVLQAIHPFDREDLKYLENDYSKYDKSQSVFVFALERYVFEQLGMNIPMLNKWMHGHVECSIRAFSVGMSLHLMYQRKSGDATTSFGNVLLNVLSVVYAYRETEVVWALFMGDDSLVCATKVALGDAIAVLAEVFNLIAKNYVTEAPYFASNFIVIDNHNCRVTCMPDPIKRVERWSMHVSSDDPQWSERFTSAQDALGHYRDSRNTALLPALVSQRYDVKESYVRSLVDAVATVVDDRRAFRDMWESEPTVSVY